MNTRPLDSFLGQKLKVLRIKKDWSIEKLAADLSIPAYQVKHYENGERIAASLIYKLAKLFAIPVSDFFDGFEQKSGLQMKNLDLNVLLISNNLNDDILIHKALKDFPKKLNLFSIHDGLEALIFFRNINNKLPTQLPKPDLILLDLHLSNVKGVEILKHLKKSSALQDIPVIIMANDITEISSSYHLHASGFINKSFSNDELKEQYYKTFNYWADTVTLPNHMA
jgi:CheY-like chemotaxis protein